MIILDLRTIILGLFFLGMVVADIILILIRLVKLYICRDVCDCRNRKCLYGAICKKYNDKLTDEEKEKLFAVLVEDKREMKRNK